MRNLHKLLISATLISLFVLSACKKECEDDDVITAKGLPMTGSQEVPPKFTEAFGLMDITYNKRTKLLTYSISWSGLTGNPVGSHIHGEAPRGVNAGIKHGFTIPAATSGTFSSSVVVDEVAIKEAGLLAGLYYINIHTPLNPGGEIRGQIEF